MRMTMTELARLAGVSQSTVSQVLNQNKSRRVKQDTEERILKLAGEYNFRVNQAASSLRRKSSYIIGVAIPLPSLPSYGDKVAYLQKELDRHGYRGFFSFYSSLENMDQALEHIYSHYIDGLISWDFHPLMEHENCPTVIYETSHPEFDSVLVDGQKYAADIMRIAGRGGSERILFIGATNNSRYQSLEDTARNAGFEIRAMGHSPHPDEGFEDILKLLKQSGPGTLVVTNDYLAQGVYSAAAESGLAIPRDIQVVGMDNWRLGTLFRPSLSSFSANQCIFKNLTELLLRRINNPQAEVIQRVVQMELIERESLLKKGTRYGKKKA